MKIILSRKSMDSKYGGIPSPIIKTANGNQFFFPLPIPFNKKLSNTKYSDIQLLDNFTAWDFIKNVSPKFEKKYGEFCHLDPDLRKSYLSNRHNEWKKSFGQVSTAQSHLDKFEVSIGDIFLFFGWFQYAEISNREFRYINKDFPNGFHAIYGYLQIGDVYEPNKPNKKVVPDFISEHPHIKYAGKPPYFDKQNNTVYVAQDFLKYDNQVMNIKGAGDFIFNENLILTQKGQTKRTIWELPLSFHPNEGVEMSYNPIGRWKMENDKPILTSAGRGQEFIFKKDPHGEIIKWATNLIKSYQISD